MKLVSSETCTTTVPSDSFAWFGLEPVLTLRLAGLAPLVRVNPRYIHIKTTLTDIIPLHTSVKDPLSRGLDQFAVVTAQVHIATTKLI